MIDKDFEKIFQDGSTTFYNSSLFFPKEVREDVFTLYAFVRTADNYVDQIPQDGNGLKQLRKMYEDALQGREVPNKTIFRFVELKKRKGFKDEWIEAFLEAMEQDLYKKTYENKLETERYIYGSAAVIGLMMARVLNLPIEADVHAQDLGKAYQYINFLRDIKEDLELERNYFPNEDQKRIGLNEYNLNYFKTNPEKFIEFIYIQLSRYEEYLKSGKAGFKSIPKRYRIAIKTATDMYNWTAKQIERNPLVVLEKKIMPSRFRIILFGIKNLIFG